MDTEGYLYLSKGIHIPSAVKHHCFFVRLLCLLPYPYLFRSVNSPSVQAVASSVQTTIRTSSCFVRTNNHPSAPVNISSLSYMLASPKYRFPDSPPLPLIFVPKILSPSRVVPSYEFWTVEVSSGFPGVVAAIVTFPSDSILGSSFPYSFIHDLFDFICII